MQAVILAAGQSSRFYPFNENHKAEIVIAGKTIIERTIDSINKAGIKNIIIIISPKSNIPQILSEKNKSKINFIIQDKPNGAGNALLIAEKYLEENFFLLNATHFDFHEFTEKMLQKKDSNVVLLAKKENRTSQYGILKVDGDLVTDIIEKPKEIQDLSLRVIGIYLFKKIFLETLKNTPAEHYQLENALAKETKKRKIKFVETEKDILTLKYSFDLLKMKNYILEALPNFISPKAEIAKSAIIINDVFIEDGARVLENAVIKGPCYIGKNSLIGNNTLIRNKSCIEENVMIGSGIEIKNCLIMENTTTHSGLIEDSILGKNCRIAAGILTANVRLDRGNVISQIRGEKIDSGLRNLGIIVGNSANFGARVTTMPGIIVGNNCLIGPSTIVMKNILPKTKYYSKFKEIIEKK